jgi:hypothetical protein
MRKEERKEGSLHLYTARSTRERRSPEPGLGASHAEFVTVKRALLD